MSGERKEEKRKREREREKEGRGKREINNRSQQNNGMIFVIGISVIKK